MEMKQLLSEVESQMEMLEAQNQTGYEQFLIFKSQVLKKQNRSESAFNKLTEQAREIVLMYANNFVSREFDMQTINRKMRFSEYTLSQKMAIIDSMNALQRAFRNVPRWLSETDAL